MLAWNTQRNLDYPVSKSQGFICHHRLSTRVTNTRYYVWLLNGLNAGPGLAWQTLYDLTISLVTFLKTLGLQRWIRLGEHGHHSVIGIWSGISLQLGPGNQDVQHIVLKRNLKLYLRKQACTSSVCSRSLTRLLSLINVKGESDIFGAELQKQTPNTYAYVTERARASISAQGWALAYF